MLESKTTNGGDNGGIQKSQRTARVTKTCNGLFQAFQILKSVTDRCSRRRHEKARKQRLEEKASEQKRRCLEGERRLQSGGTRGGPQI